MFRNKDYLLLLNKLLLAFVPNYTYIHHNSTEPQNLRNTVQGNAAQYVS